LDVEPHRGPARIKRRTNWALVATRAAGSATATNLAAEAAAPDSHKDKAMDTKITAG